MVSIVLIGSKFEANVAMVVRLAAAYKIPTVICVKPRYKPEDRIPRELRMFKQVVLLTTDRMPEGLLVGVERRVMAESLKDFVHPIPFPDKEISYVFGPEDGDISQGTLRRCSRFVQIPVEVSMNLATAVATVLWDRKLKGG